MIEIKDRGRGPRTYVPIAPSYRYYDYPYYYSRGYYPIHIRPGFIYYGYPYASYRSLYYRRYGGRCSNWHRRCVAINRSSRRSHQRIGSLRMSLTLLGCALVVSSAAISALLIFALRSDVARRDLLSRLRSSSRWFGQGTARVWIVPAAAFLLVAGIGAATSYLRDPPEATGSRDAMSSLSRSGLNGEMLARLTDYARSIGNRRTGVQGGSRQTAA